MRDVDALLWRALNRLCLVLVTGVVGLLLGLGQHPSRLDSLLGLLVVLLVVVPVAVTVSRMPPSFRRALPDLPRHRPLLTVMSALLGFVIFLVLSWTVMNAVFPGGFAPLTLALLGALAAAATGFVGSSLRRRKGKGRTL